MFDDAEAWCEAMLGTMSSASCQAGRPGAAPGVEAITCRASRPTSGISSLVDVKQPEHKHLEGLTLAERAAPSG